MEIQTSFAINEPICGETIEIMKQIPDKSIDMILADLPYGITEAKWDSIIPLDKLWEQYLRIIKDRGAILIFGIQPFTTTLISSCQKYYKYNWIWEKKRAAGYMHAKQQPLRAAEDICVFYKKQPTYNPQMVQNTPYRFKPKVHPTETYGDRQRVTEVKSEDGLRYPRNIIQFDNANYESSNKQFHPTQKPLALLEYLIKTYTNEGDLVLDNTAGSFSTCVAAQNLNRKWVGIEQDYDYCKIGLNRLLAAKSDV